MGLRPKNDDPGDYTLEPWVIGSAVGVFILSIVSDCIFKNKLFFTPIAACLLLELSIEIALTVVAYYKPDFDRYNSYLLFSEGFIESSMQFYLFFLTPIKIANKYRYS